MKTNLLKIGVAVLTIALLVGTVTFCKREFGEQDLTVEVTGIKVYPSDLATSGGSVTQLRAVVLPVGAQDTAVVWSTNRPEVATVDKHGKVTAMGMGFASITVRHANKNYSARCDVNVKTDAYSVTGITLNKTSLTLSMANYKSATLQAFIMHEYARNKTVTWSSDNTAVVTVSATGVVTAVSAGSARVTARTADGGKTAYCSVTVAAAVPVSDVKLSPQNLPLYIGDKEQLQATILPADAANKAVTWLSCNPNIATVSSSGLVTGVGAGMTTIIVTTVQGSNTAFCNVTVSPHVTSITLKPSLLVVVKGTTTGVTTDLNGSYDISAPQDTTLTFSFVGLGQKQESVGGKTRIDITLSADEQNIEEVVVVGYGTATKESITGSVSAVSSRKIEGRQVTSVTSALDGNVAGIIFHNSGTPGSEPTIRIRGISTVNGNNSPLYVVDGVPLMGNISDLNQADIEDMTVLKDAASAALYGSKAANGVVIITTKRGKKGKAGLHFSANVNIGAYSRGIPEYETLGVKDWMETMAVGYRNYLISNSDKKVGDVADVPRYTLETATPQAFGTSDLINTYIGAGYNIFAKPSDQLFDANGKFIANVNPKYADLDWWNAVERVGIRKD